MEFLKKGLFVRIAAVVAAATLCAGMCLAVAGCSQEQEDPTEAIRAQLEEGFDYVKTELADVDQDLLDSMGLDADTLAAFEQMNLEPAAFVKSLFDGFDYTVGDITISEDGNSAEAAVTMKMKDLAEWAKALEAGATELAASGITDENELMAKVGPLMLESLDNVQGMTDIPITIEVKKENGEWTVDQDQLSEEVSTQMMNAFNEVM